MTGSVSIMPLLEHITDIPHLNSLGKAIYFLERGFIPRFTAHLEILSPLNGEKDNPDSNN